MNPIASLFVGAGRAIKSSISFLDRSEGPYPSQYYGFPRVPWTSDIADHKESSTGSASASLRDPAVFAAVRNLSEDIANLPLIVYRRDGSNKDRATDHPLYEVLHDFANPDMSAFTWREVMMGNLLLWGNCYSEKVYDRAGRLQLWPLAPDRMEVYWNAAGRKTFTYTLSGGDRKEMRPESVFHVPGFGGNGLVGYSLIRLARDTIGEASAARLFAGSFLRRGMSSKVIVKLPKAMPDTEKAKFADAWRKQHEGAARAWGTAFIEEGTDVDKLTMPLEDAQFLEQRKHSVTDVARWFRMPPDKLQDLERATFSNIEHQDLAYAKYSLSPHCGRFEAAIKQQLLRDEPGFFAEFLLDGLLRGDAINRAQSNQIRLRNGTLTPDEWRAMENLNPLPDGLGQRPYFARDLAPMTGEADLTDLTPTLGNGNGRAAVTIEEAIRP